MNQVGLTYNRPWGSYRTVEMTDNYQIKHISVDAGKRLSLQRHTHRSEHWTIIEGAGVVQLGGDLVNVSVNSQIYIPKTVLHRVTNTGLKALKFIEVQIGDYLGEDDIERVEDDFGRT